MIDPTGHLVVLLRAYLASLDPGHPWAEAWVHGGGIPTAKDPRGIVVQRISHVRERFHLGRYRYAIRAYGVLSPNLLASEQDASVGSGLVSDALHQIGPVRSGSGVLTYKALEEVGGQPGRDPDTGWEYETSIYLVHAATQVASA